MAASFGIHFGATSACLAACKDGKAIVVANDAGDRTTPAVVSFTNHDQTVGLSAKQGLLRNAANTVCRVKQLLGKSWAELESDAQNSPVKIVNKNGSPHYEVSYKEKPLVISPVDIAKLIYKKMMDIAMNQGGIADSHEAVITVPLHFTKQQTDASCEAARKAGFRVMRVISEPAAALLAYDIGQINKSCTTNLNVLVYCLGGSALDITVIRVINGMYRIIACYHNDSIGGQMIEQLLIDHFAVEFKRKWKVDCRENKRSVAKLRNAAENCKHILSSVPTTQCAVESLYEGMDFQSTVSRSRFDMLCNTFVQESVRQLDTAISEAKMTKEDIHKVILCGGTAKIPSLQQQIQDALPKAELLCSVPPDEVIAQGAAKEASIICGLDEAMMETNSQQTGVQCLPVDLLIQESTDDSVYSTVLPRLTPLPAKVQREIQLASEQTSFVMNVCCRGSNSDTATLLAKVAMSDLTEGSIVSAVFHVKGDCSVSVTCLESCSKKSQHFVIESS